MDTIILSKIFFWLGVVGTIFPWLKLEGTIMFLVLAIAVRVVF